jgi:hypothetical protein
MVAAPTERRTRLASVYGYQHAFLRVGVILVAAGLKRSTAHPLEGLGDLVAIELAAGTALFVGVDAVFLRVLGIGSRPARAAGVFAALATIPLGITISAAVQVAALAVIVTAAVAADRERRPKAPSPMGGTGLEPVTPSLSIRGRRSRRFTPVREKGMVERNPLGERTVDRTRANDERCHCCHSA